MIEQYGLGIFVVLVFVVLPALIAMILIFNHKGNAMNINQQILHNIANNISKGYGKHPVLQLECLEWFTCLLNSNKDRFGVTSVSNHTMGSDWEDRSACIGQIQSPPARALLTLLVWGFDQKEYMTVKDHLAGVIKPSDKTNKELLNK